MGAEGQSGLDSFLAQGQGGWVSSSSHTVCKGHCRRALLGGQSVWSGLEPQSPGDGRGMAVCRSLFTALEGQLALQLPRNKLQLLKLRAWPCGKANRTLMTSTYLEPSPRGALRGSGFKHGWEAGAQKEGT